MGGLKWQIYALTVLIANALVTYLKNTKGSIEYLYICSVLIHQKGLIGGSSPAHSESKAFLNDRGSAIEIEIKDFYSIGTQLTE